MLMKRLIAAGNVAMMAPHLRAGRVRMECARELLTRVDVNGTYNSQLGGALNVACHSGNEALVELLVESGASQRQCIRTSILYSLLFELKGLT